MTTSNINTGKLSNTSANMGNFKGTKIVPSKIECSIKESLFKMLVSELQKSGGFSYSFLKGDFAPKSGYMVNIGSSIKGVNLAKEGENTFAAIAGTIGQFIRNNGQELVKENTYLGAYVEDSILHLEISQRFSNIRIAKVLGNEYKQGSIFELSTSKTIEL